MTPDELKRRIRNYALRCIRLAESFPSGMVGQTIGRQLLRAGTNAAANYRAACLGRSRAEFVSKLGTVQEEADESVFWIELSVDAGLVKENLVA